MAFESLSERLNGVFKKLRGKGKLSEADIKAAMREVRMALLEADVNYKVAKDFCAQVSERAMGQEVMESLTPAQQVVKIVNEELTKLMGGEEPQTLHIKNKGQTVMMMCGTAAPPEEEVDFVLNRPFVFAITGTDGLPLFVGIVHQPQP